MTTNDLVFKICVIFKVLLILNPRNEGDPIIDKLGLSCVAVVGVWVCTVTRGKVCVPPQIINQIFHNFHIWC